MQSKYLKSLETHEKSVSDSGQLSRDYGQDGHVDTIELIETAPGTTLAQPGEYLADSLKHNLNRRVTSEE